MCTCPPNLTHSALTVCKIITFKVEQKVFFPYARGVQQSFGGSKNHFLKGIWNVTLHILVPKWVRYMSPKSHTKKRCGTLWKNSFSARGYAEIHTQGLVFEPKKSIREIHVHFASQVLLTRNRIHLNSQPYGPIMENLVVLCEPQMQSTMMEPRSSSGTLVSENPKPAPLL
jgi:hypothetical protein